ncbi:hypothetical protein GCM10011584_35290 [Nocardioides phosphati]|uniref:AAA domain-containing protein n=1 Tax=Nocardioides phosphati TaxID=1867775 RepID=A0ABQ2NE04_9ACTN|nr:ParA family protein [Nocardioides phosphati]GGO94384.1 hypothetical protein GCM10011584_35290 [Nocardioides phosphati]
MNEMSRVITFATGKGGTGKTSCAANVAGLAAQAGWRTLLIDLDSQANLGHDLGFSEAEGADGGASLVKAVFTGSTLEPVLKQVRHNLDVIPGGSKLDELEDILHGKQRRGEDGRLMLRDSLAGIADQYDLIVIDTPPARRSALVLLALAAAKWIVIPTKSDRSSIEGLRVLAEQVVGIREVNPDVDVLGAVLFGMGAAATARRRFAADDVKNVLGSEDLLFNSIIRHAEAAADDAREKGRLIHELAEVVHNAEPYWKALKEGRRPERIAGSAPALAEDYVLLADELLRRIGQAEEAEAGATQAVTA